MNKIVYIILVNLLLLIEQCRSFESAEIPLVVNTWDILGFSDATENAWNELNKNNNAIDALESGCRSCQNAQCRFTVGFGGSPDETGETTLDALIFDGDTFNMGAVGGLRNIKDAIGVARKVLENTEHSILVGSLASDFANNFGFPKESLETEYSHELHENWHNAHCQPNFWMNVLPDPKKSCGPYKRNTDSMEITNQDEITVFNTGNHDTIGMIVINSNGHIVAGTSTNGANHKIPGRIGDSPIPGAGAYANSSVGASTATGDGDVMMRFLPSFLAVEEMRMGATPSAAAKTAINRIAEKFPSFFGAIIAVNKEGIIGAACNGMKQFPYSMRNGKTEKVLVKFVNC